MNPFGKMPVLETDEGTAIFESTSILEYLEERGPRRLLPPGQELRARHFDRIGDLYLLNPVGKFFWHKESEVRDETIKVMSMAWPLWERELADGRNFICGDEITLADLSASIAARCAVTEDLPLSEPIQRYRERLEANPVIRRRDRGRRPLRRGDEAEARQDHRHRRGVSHRYGASRDGWVHACLPSAVVILART